MKTTLTRIEKAGDALRVTLSTGEHVDTDQCCSPPAAIPNTGGLGLERAGVKLDDAGAVIVDEYSHSSVDSVYAIGDVTNRMNLTPVAIRDGHALRRHHLQQPAHARGPPQRAERGVRPPAQSARLL